MVGISGVSIIDCLLIDYINKLLYNTVEHRFSNFFPTLKKTAVEPQTSMELIKIQLKNVSSYICLKYTTYKHLKGQEIKSSYDRYEGFRDIRFGLSRLDCI